jgi:hypothetical protein
MTTDLIKQI